MTRTILLEVTPADIRDGRRAQCHACPIGLALQRATNDPNAWAGLDRFHVPSHAPLTMQSPPEFKPFMLAFDKGQPVQPFTLSMELPDASTPT